MWRLREVTRLNGFALKGVQRITSIGKSSVINFSFVFSIFVTYCDETIACFTDYIVQLCIVNTIYI